MTTTPSLTQDKILAAAKILIAQNGYKATTTKQIASLANLNESTLFKNFHNKLDLFLALHEQESKALEMKLQQIFAASYDTTEKLIHYSVPQIYDVFIQHHNFIAISLRELGNEQLRLGINSFFEYTTNQLSMYVAKLTQLSPDTFTAAMFMLVSALMCMVVNQTNHYSLTDDLPSPITVEQIGLNAHAMIQNLI